MSEYTKPFGAEVRVRRVNFDSTSNAPVVILQTCDGQLDIPLFMSVMDAGAIALELEGVDSARPMAHDLMERLIHALGGAVDRVVIDDMQENTFLATLFVRRETHVFALDARPSDALALALKSRAKIFVSETVLLKAGRSIHGEGQGALPV